MCATVNDSKHSTGQLTRLKKCLAEEILWFSFRSAGFCRVRMAKKKAAGSEIRPLRSQVSFFVVVGQDINMCVVDVQWRS